MKNLYSELLKAWRKEFSKEFSPHENWEACQSLEQWLLKSFEICYQEGYQEGKEDTPEEFYVCPQHIATGGYESCCACSGDRLCTEAIVPDKG